MHEMQTIRSKMGVCPQHSVLYADLTVEEHLYFFAALKNVCTGSRKREVDAIVAKVGLTEKRHVLSASLSGGMKRKLSVAIAVLGDSEVVYLDEPTSGMDPYSRRATWQVLKESRHINTGGSNPTPRTIVLTTHFMDEADLLGDRIAIMAKGKLQVCGSSLFLKSRFGLGYCLTIVQDVQKGVLASNTDGIVGVLDQHLGRSGYTVTSKEGAELSLKLPLDAVSVFPALFDQLDASKTDFNIGAYGISMTTLEEVFLKLSNEEEHSEQPHNEIEGKPADPETPPAGTVESQLPAVLQPASLIMQMKVMLTKRWHCTRRDKRSVMFETFVPVVTTALVLLLLINNGASVVVEPKCLVFLALAGQQSNNHPWWSCPEHICCAPKLQRFVTSVFLGCGFFKCPTCECGRQWVSTQQCNVYGGQRGHPCVRCSFEP